MSTVEPRAASRPASAPGSSTAHRLALARVAVGAPVMVWGLRRRSVGWTAAGAVLVAHGMLELAYESVFPRDLRDLRDLRDWRDRRD